MCGRIIYVTIRLKHHAYNGATRLPLSYAFFPSLDLVAYTYLYPFVVRNEEKMMRIEDLSLIGFISTGINSNMKWSRNIDEHKFGQHTTRTLRKMQEHLQREENAKMEEHKNEICRINFVAHKYRKIVF